MDAALATIIAMRKQEESGYAVVDQYKQQQHLREQLLVHGIDNNCRMIIASWCYQVADFCKYQRVTVEIAMNCLDRFIATPAGQAAFLDRSVYQLAAMTCLYTAVKIHEPEIMDSKTVSKLSRGTYTAAQIEEMEASVLMALNWRVNPPTALAFVRQLLKLVPAAYLSGHTRTIVYDNAKYLTELAVSESDFITFRSSAVAFCSLMNSLESIGLDERVLMKIRSILSRAIGMHDFQDIVLEVQTLLYKAVLRQKEATSDNVTIVPHSPADDSCAKSNRRSSSDISPRSTVR